MLTLRIAVVRGHAICPVQVHRLEAGGGANGGQACRCLPSAPGPDVQGYSAGLGRLHVLGTLWLDSGGNGTPIMALVTEGVAHPAGLPLLDDWLKRPIGAVSP